MADTRAELSDIVRRHVIPTLPEAGSESYCGEHCVGDERCPGGKLFFPLVGLWSRSRGLRPLNPMDTIQFYLPERERITYETLATIIAQELTLTPPEAQDLLRLSRARDVYDAIQGTEIYALMRQGLRHGIEDVNMMHIGRRAHRTADFWNEHNLKEKIAEQTGVQNVDLLLILFAGGEIDHDKFYALARALNVTIGRPVSMR